MCYVHEYTENKNVFSECLKESLLMAGSLWLTGNQFHIIIIIIIIINEND